MTSYIAVLTDDELAFEAAHAWSAKRAAAVKAEIAFRIAECSVRAAS